MAENEQRPAGQEPASPEQSHADTVRNSREGDQFHYLWAARRLLRLLNPTSTLVAVSIEGASTEETAKGPIAAGEEVIDIGEYYGSEHLPEATSVRYLQLKHSTISETEPWAVAGLKTTVKGFAKRYKSLRTQIGPESAKKVEFLFVTNRPIEEAVKESLADLTAEATPRHPRTAAALERYAGLENELALSFWRQFSLLPEEGGRKDQQAALGTDLLNYLPGPDAEARLQLKELVVQRVMPNPPRGPAIRRTDVLTALGVSLDELFPCPNRLEEKPDAVPRKQEIEIAKKIESATEPVVIEAPSGVGKSILSMRLGHLMPDGSVSVVFDCFGSGDYRRAARPRHRVKDAFVQIANELAQRGLCDLLLPSTKADEAAYFRALISRLQQVVATVQRTSATALVTLVIDAADNAEMGAEEAGDHHSFVRPLLRQPMPPGVRLAMLCRPDRTSRLDPPPLIHQIKLEPFTEQETATHLRQFYPGASEEDATEFHRRSSHNPRVQATAMSLGLSLSDLLAWLGPDPRGVDDVIAAQLDAAVKEALDVPGKAQRDVVESLFASLAILRPLIPLQVLSAVSGATVDAIRSFAVDFAKGRPLLIAGDSIQFRDEPVEDWFRKTYRPTKARLSEFIDRLKHLADASTYVAATLPSMLLEAGRLDELVEMALAATYLPSANALERRDINLQRLQFALRASLKSKRYLEGAKLAQRVGVEAAGNSRHLQLIQDNTDLAGKLLQPGTIQDIVSRRGLTGKWLGARHAHEASLMAEVPALAPEARSTLRLAHEFVRGWSRLPKEDRAKQPVTLLEISEMALASLRLFGPAACIAELMDWTPKSTTYHAMRVITSRLIDAGDVGALTGLSEEIAKSTAFMAGLAFADEMAKACLIPDEVLVRMLLELLPPEGQLTIGQVFDGKALAIGSVANLVAAAARHGLDTHEKLAAVLRRQLPPEPPRGWHAIHGEWREPHMEAYSILAGLNGGLLDLNQLAHPDLQSSLKDSDSMQSVDARRFKAVVAPVWRLASLHARWRIKAPETGTVRHELAELRQSLALTYDAREDERFVLQEEQASLWLKSLAIAPADDPALTDFVAWLDDPDRHLSDAAYARLARIAAHTPHLVGLVHDFCRRAMRHQGDSTDHVGQKIDQYVAIARAVLSLDQDEAAAYLEQAVEIASRIGDDAYDRWDSLIKLGEKASEIDPDRADIAYSFGRCAEVMRIYLDKYFDWSATLDVLCGISAVGGVAVASRWRDRSVGWFDDVLTGTIEALVKRQKLDPREAAAFLGFDFHWSYRDLLDNALRTVKSVSEAKAILAILVRSLRLSPGSAEIWHEIERVAKSYKLSMPENVLPGEIAKSVSTPAATSSDSEIDSQWATIFGSDDLGDAGGFSAVFGRSDYLLRQREGERGFWHQAFRRVKLGSEAKFIGHVLSHPKMGPYELGSFLKEVPENWRSRLAVIAAFKQYLAGWLAANHLFPWYGRRDDRITLQMIAAAAGEPVEWALSSVLNAFGADTSSLESGEAFQLVCSLAQMLPPSDALSALADGLKLIENILRETDGDGDWSPALEPPGMVPRAIASLLWACLGAAEAKVRWQAAHVVRNLCALEESAVLDELIELAKNAPLGPFVDRRFVFYRYNALMWFLIGLARAALEHPEMVMRYKTFLLDQAFPAEPHVLIRHFAAEAIAALRAAGFVSVDGETAIKLQAVNRSPFPLLVSERYNLERTGPARREWSDRRFQLAFDADNFWLDPLGEIFGLTEQAVEDIAVGIICDDWKMEEYSGFGRDARHAAGVVQDRDLERSSRPSVDSLAFYISFHAAMITAGKLLDTQAAYVEYQGEDSRFDEWLRRHLLTRQDGRWLSDRRDPVPSDLELLRAPDERKEWRWTVDAEELSRGMQCRSGWLVVRGDWTRSGNFLVHQTQVRSALVNREKSEALLRSLQTTANAHLFHLPTAGGDAEIDEEGFELKGWIRDYSAEQELDEHDPWAADIPYPPPAPAQFIVEALDLKTDPEEREWKDGDETVLRAEIWGSAPDHPRDSYPPDRGDRLLVTLSGLRRLLEKFGVDLVVEVQIDHRLDGRLEHDDEFRYELVYPYARIFLVKSDGTVTVV